MAKTKTFRQFSAEWVERIKNCVIGWERRFDATGRRKRTLGGDDGEDGSNGGSTDGGAGGGCCCNESNCLKPIAGVAELPKPDYRAIPYLGICGCEGGGTSDDFNGGSIELYRASEDSDDVWIQEHGEDATNPMRCRYPDCGSRGVWEWDGAAWILLSNSFPSCGMPPEPEDPGTEIGQQYVTDYEPPTYPAYWKETKLPKDANGCDQSKLELIIEDGA